MSVSSFSSCLGWAAACDCGTPWTFLLPFVRMKQTACLVTDPVMIASHAFTFSFYFLGKIFVGTVMSPKFRAHDSPHKNLAQESKYMILWHWPGQTSRSASGCILLCSQATLLKIV